MSRSVAAVATVAMLVWRSPADGSAQTSSPHPVAIDVRRSLDEGSYSAAEALATELAVEVEAAHGPDSVDMAAALDLRVEALYRNGKSAAPETVWLAERAVDLKQRLLSPGHPDSAVSLLNIGAIRAERGEYAAARQLLERALTIRITHFGPDDPSTADARELLAPTLIYTDRFAEADQQLAESRRVRERHADDQAALGRTLYLVALLHRQDGGYAEAARVLEQVLEIQQRGAPRHPDMIRILRLRGDLLFFSGDSAAALTAWSEALELAERTVGAEHPLVPPLLRWLASAKASFGDLPGAQELLERGLAIGERVFAPCHREYAALLNDTANLASSVGDYARARTFYARTLAIDQRCLGPTHSLTATVIHNQGLLAMLTGDLAEADRFHTSAVRAWSAGLGPTHPYVARGLDALADVATARGQGARARALYERALAIRLQQLGEAHPDTAWTLANLAQTSLSAGNRVLALGRVDRALDIYRRGAASQDPDHFALALAIRGELLSAQGDFAGARASFAEALATRQQIFGSAHPLTASARAELAAVDFALGDGRSALEGALLAEDAGRDHLRFTVRYLPERQAVAYAARRPHGLDLALSIVAAGLAPDLTSTVDALIRSRAVIFDEFAARARTASASMAGLAPLNQQALSARQRLANLMLRSIEGDGSVNRALLDQARDQKEEIERTLAERSVAVQNESTRARVGVGEVVRALPNGSAVIAFARYDRVLPVPPGAGSRRSVPSYIAFVIRRDHPVAAVPLGSAAAIEARISAWRQAIVRSDTPDQAAGEQLRRRVWDPVARFVERVDHVFLVPDGALNLVSFDALPIGASRYFVEAGPTTHVIQAERDLVPDDVATPHLGLLIVGGAIYGAHADSVALEAHRSVCGAAAPLQFEDLPGSRAEVADIAHIWSTTQGASGSENDLLTLTGRGATKYAVTRAVTGRRVIHLSTHGFFLASPCEPSSRYVRGVGGLVPASFTAIARMDNPLLLSGLAFAGANNRVGAETRGNGSILTAEEIAGLELNGTEWAVLSACDTGLGEIRAGEGVFGLRRAFQIAGARTVIMSLWSVEDSSTADWMRSLYEARFRQRLSTADAVHAASLRVLTERRRRGESTNPFFWAGFVAAGDWR